ncbi:MAG TPA: NUDIX domain-containing protein [Chthonomonas sp.]|uniref:NUDIX hydrolase n=1 Tax=Chthonomonas sp. TaxID=2282153 RepID=UPI002B4B2D06|nr:NUDIX domain-containing protein [Chthonomonas sp.]HLH79587.1 NUDIX domain-containing protein [Chthonomonas sp.]
MLAFVFANGQALLARIRGRGWCVPSGHVEPGETPEKAIRREIREEIGANVGDLHLLGHYLLSPPDASPYLAAVYYTSLLSQEAIPEGSESQEARLFPLEAFPTNYYFWDALLEAVCRYAFEQATAQDSSTPSSA